MASEVRAVRSASQMAWREDRKGGGEEGRRRGDEEGKMGKIIEVCPFLHVLLLVACVRGCNRVVKWEVKELRVMLSA